jgi:hypothetical protein
MKCEELQLNLSVYLDDILTNEERACLDEHLAQCPLCRQKLSDFQSLRQNLRNIPRAEVPNALVNSIRNRVAQEIQTDQQKSAYTDNVRAWINTYLMPYSIGTVASLVFGFLLLWTLSTSSVSEQNINFAKNEKTTILLADSNTAKVREKLSLNENEYPELSLNFTGESPTINPQGALIALTKSLARGEMKDDEVVVVADVFGNGLAQIAAVVEPSNDKDAVRELEEALRTNPDFAPPFLPANIDHRSDTVRVVLKIQTVNVKTSSKP